MNVIQFKRPETKQTKPVSNRRGVAEFVVVMGVIGLAFFLLPTIWSSVPQQLLAVLHLLVAVVYYQQGPRVVSAIWIGLTLACLVMTGAPSPVTYGLSRAAWAIDAATVQ